MRSTGPMPNYNGAHCTMVPIVLAGVVLALFMLVPFYADAALTRGNHGTFTSATGYGTGSYQTSAFTPSNNSLLVVVVGAQLNGFNTGYDDAVTVSGGGLTWTRRLKIEDPTQDIDEFSDALLIFTAPVAAGASMQVTVDAGAFDSNHYKVNVFAYTGYNASSPVGSTASAYAHDPASGVTTIMLDSAPTLSSEVVAAVNMGWEGSPDVTAGTGWTQQYNDYVDFARLQTQTRTSSTSQAVRWNDADAAYTRLLGAIEINAGGTLSRPPNNLGLLGYWSFNEGTSTVATDFSGSGNVGTLTGNPTWANGKRGKAVRLDGTGDYVGVSTFPSSGSVSAGGWFNLASLQYHSNDLDVANLVSKSLWAGDADGDFQLILAGPEVSGTTDQLQAVVYTSTGEHRLPIDLSSTELSTNSWHHIFLVYDQAATDLYLYLNGRLIATESNADGTRSTNSHAIRIGAFPGNEANTEIHGSIDEVRIYNRALTQAQVLQLYGSGAVRFSSNSTTLTQGSSLQNGLVGHWTFDGQDFTNAGVYSRAGNLGPGYVAGSVATSALKTIGKLGQGATANNGDEEIFIFPPGGLDLTSSFTLAAWFKADTITTGSTYRTLMGYVFSDGYWLEMLDDEAECGFSSGGTPQEYSTNSENLTTNTWYHITCVFDNAADTVKIYINGVERDNNTGVTGAPNANGSAFTLLSIGGTQAIDGVLDDARVYNRALTPAEVKQLSNLGKAKIVQ